MTLPEDPSGASELTTSVTDAVARVIGGERESFAVVVKAYERRLVNLCLAMLGEMTAAEEITQEAFIRAYRYLNRFDPSRPFYPWLAKIAVRLAQQHRRRQRTPELPLTIDIDQNAANDHPLTGLIQDQRANELWKAVLDLPVRERAAVMLFYRQELTVNETANCLGVTSGTVKTLLFRARRHLRSSLARDERREP